MGASIDVRKAHRHRVHGDLLAVQTWVNDERSLVLIAHKRKGAGWFIVGDSVAWMWNINAVDPSDRAEAMRYADQRARNACDILDLEPSLMNRARIIGIVTDALEEIVKMPSAPEQAMMDASFGEMRLMADGKVIAAEDIKLEQTTGATYG
jgi:hypothetical protein